MKVKKRKKLSLSKQTTILIGAILLTVINIASFSYASLVMFKQVNVPVASDKLYSRSKIKESDIIYKKYPISMISDQIYTDANDFIGKVVTSNSSLAKGSFFFMDVIASESEVKDMTVLDVKEGQSIYPLEVNLIRSSGNIIKPGYYLDVYVELAPRKFGQDVLHDKIYDKFISQAKVLAVRDSKGKDLDFTSDDLPVVVLLAIDDEIVKYLKLAFMYGSIDVYVTSKSLLDTESIIEESMVLEWLKKLN